MLRQEKQSASAICQLVNGTACRHISVALVFIAPTVLALATSINSPVSPVPAQLVDTGISKVRSGKAIIRAAMPALTTDRESLRLSLDGFRVEGDPRLVPEALDDILAPWRGKTLSFTEYEQAIHAVAAYLRTNGHPNAQVRMSRAVVGGGAVMIAIDGLSENKPVIASAEIIPKVDVKRFKFTGLTLVPESELQAVLSELSGRPLTAAEMEESAKKVADYMRSKGYPLVQAYLPPQRVDTGELEIKVQEGGLDGTLGRDGLTVAGAGVRVKTSIVEEFLMRGSKPGEPLRVVDLERAVLLASDLPGIQSITTQIEPGSQPGTTQIKATVEEAKVFVANAITDNYGSRYTGEARVLAQAQLNSPFGYGEQLSFNAVKSSLMSSTRVGAQAPIGTNGLKAGAAYSSLRAKFGLDVAILDLNSQADIATVFANYPLIRTAETNVNVGLNYDRKQFVTVLTGSRENDRQINLATFGASGDFIDKLGGQTRWSSGVGVGRLDLSANALYADTDAKTAKTQGGFSKLNWQVSRLSVLSENKLWTWQLGVSGQIASKNLDSAEKFQLGGPGGIRAYPVGEGLGDNGWLANLEVRYRLADIQNVKTQVFGFYDMGGVTQYANSLQGTRNNSFLLKGVGVGASFAVGAAGEIKLMVSRKLGSNPNSTLVGNDADGQNKSARVWIMGSIVF